MSKYNFILFIPYNFNARDLYIIRKTFILTAKKCFFLMKVDFSTPKIYMHVKL